MKEFLKFISIAIGAAIVLIGGTLMFLSSLMTDDLSYYSKKDLMRNYDKHASEINELKRYVRSITPIGDMIDIEFKNSNEFGRFNLNHLSYYNIKVNSKQADSLFKKLNWSIPIIRTLKSKLDAANCISVANVDPFIIEWQRSGVGVYSYYVFDRPLNDSLKKAYTNGCNYSFYKNNVVLNYEGGTTSNLCSEEFKK